MEIMEETGRSVFNHTPCRAPKKRTAKRLFFGGKITEPATGFGAVQLA